MKILFCLNAKKAHGKPNCAKDYPDDFTKELIIKLKEKGHTLIQTGLEGDTQYTEDFRKGLWFKDLCKLVNEVDLILSVDSYLQHVAWHCGKKAIVIFSLSDPLIFGHKENINLLKDRKYLRVDQFGYWHEVQYNKEAFIEPNEVLKYA
jgi:ADP-heptose:LPS heptosyltransferase